MTILPQRIIDCMAESDRIQYARDIGKPSFGLTSTEAREKAATQDEKHLQRQIADYLRLMQIECINPPMHKRSTLPQGWPDFTFAYRGKPIAVECKVWSERPMPEQNQRMDAMRNNGWLCHVCRSLQDVQDLLRAIDANLTSTPHGAPAPADHGGGR